MLSLWTSAKRLEHEHDTLYGYKGRGNWHLLTAAKHLRKPALQFIEQIRPQVPSKNFKNAKISLSCKRTETRVYYKILLYWHDENGRHFYCADMNQFAWCSSSTAASHSDVFKEIRCPNCRWDDYFEEFDCNDHYHSYVSKQKGSFQPNSAYRKIHNLCKKFVDKHANSIPIRKQTPKFNTIHYNRSELYYLIRYIKAVYLKQNETFFGRKVKHKIISKKVKGSEEEIFLFIANLSVDVIRMIINRL